MYMGLGVEDAGLFPTERNFGGNILLQAELRGEGCMFLRNRHFNHLRVVNNEEEMAIWLQSSFKLRSGH